MKAKQLEVMLGTELGIGEAEMVQRFQTLRDFNMLPVSRGRNAEDISSDEVVSGLLSIVAARPGYAGVTAKVLRGLRPVGAQIDAFAKARTFGEALHAMLENDNLLESVVEIRLSDSEIYTNSNGRGVIVHRIKNKEYTSYYVGQTAVSLFHSGAEKTYDPRDLISSMIREIVIFPRVMMKLRREVQHVNASAAIL